MAKNNNEAKIKFTAETGEFNEQIKSAESSMRELRSELKLNSTEMKATGESAELLRDRHKILQKELAAAKEKTEALSEKVEKAKKIYGENSDEVKRLQTQLNNAKTAEQNIQKEINDTNTKLKDQKTAFDNVSESAEKVGDKLTSAGQAMTKVSAGIVAVGAASIASFNAVDEGADNVIKATGATGEAAKELEESYGKVASAVVGDFADIGAAVGEVNTRFGYTGEELEAASISFEKFASITGMDAADAVKAVSRALNDAGIPLDEYDSLLDQLAKAGQSAGIDVATLADSLSKNGAIMRSMGFDTEETIALLSQFELSGADASTMLTGMKRAMATWAEEGKNGNDEFAKTVEGIKKGSITASDALDIFGTKAGPMLVDAIKTGKFEYKDMLKVIENSKGTVESTFDGTVDGGYEMELAMQNAKIALGEVGETLATTLAPIVTKATEKLRGFASWWSNLSEKSKTTIITIAGVVAAIGPLLLVAGKVSSSVSKIASLVGNLSKAASTASSAFSALGLATGPLIAIVAVIAVAIAAIITLWKTNEDFRNNITGIWNDIKTTFDEFGQGIVDRLNALGFDFENFTEVLKSAWMGFCNLLGPYFTGVFNYVAITFEYVLNLITNILDIFIGIFTGNWSQAWDGVKGIFVSTWNYLCKWFQNIGNVLRGTLDVILGWCGTNWTRVWSSIKNFFVNVWNGIKNTASSVWNGIKNTASSVWNGIRGFFVNTWNGIRTTAANVWNGVKNAILTPIEAAKNKIKSIIDTIKGFFSGLKLSLPKIKLPHFSIQGKLSLNPPSVPKLKIDWYKDGGIFTKPTIFSTASGFKGVGEAGAEAVLPIDRLQGYISGAIERSVQTVNLQSLANAIEDLANRPIDLNINGRQFAQATAGDTDSVGGMRTSLMNRGLALS